jgi:hypothetical protein
VILNLKYRMTPGSVFHAAPPSVQLLSQLKPVV